MTKSMVVTGAAKGIGHAVVLQALESGWHVVGVDIDDDPLTRSDLGTGFWPISGDVSLRETHERAAAHAIEIGDLVGWVNNAGIDVPGRAHEIGEAELRRAIDVNLIGTALGCATALRAFLAGGRRGAIVNLSSIQAVAGFPAAFAYEASKGGIDSLTRQVAVEYGPAGVRCNAVQPGCVATPMTWAALEASADPERELAGYAELHPIERLAEPQEIASVIVFLLSDASSFVNGVCLPVDGGATARCFRYPPDDDLPRLNHPLPAR